jgi:predicted NUDIX family NTP pyrophosphohydrolase
MTKQSAGILVYRERAGELEFFLVHPGGPLWQNKDAGYWSIPKGEFVGAEEPLEAAKREFKEETGMTVEGEFVPLGSVKQRGGKIVHAWAVRGDFDAAKVRSNTFELEWPPRSGRFAAFPEVDRGEWFSRSAAQDKIKAAQVEFLDQVVGLVARGGNKKTRWR